MLTAGQQQAAYRWPFSPFDEPHWVHDRDDASWSRSMPEALKDVAQDSRWPAFFPSPITLVTTGVGGQVGLEKVVGASIVNRFPYIVALSFCRETLSERHYARTRFCDLLESSGTAAVQFLPTGDALKAVMRSIEKVPDRNTSQRLEASGVRTRRGASIDTSILEDAYMVYETRLVSPMDDFRGEEVLTSPYRDVGSHRIYFMEIIAIQLRRDIAEGSSQILWRSLPQFSPASSIGEPDARERQRSISGYRKPYTPNYKWPAPGNQAFEWDTISDGMAVKTLKSEVLLDNDAARWPCFFPQSAGLITSTSPDGVQNMMPCGSTTIVSRNPLVIAPCISYVDLNERYAARATLSNIEQSRSFGCGVPFINDRIVDAIRYAGNTSVRGGDPDKLVNSGLRVGTSGAQHPTLTDVPVFFDCRVIDSIRLGTHVMFFGEVTRIRVRDDVGVDSPITWCPWPDVAEVGSSSTSDSDLSALTTQR